MRSIGLKGIYGFADSKETSAPSKNHNDVRELNLQFFFPTAKEK